MCDMYVWYQVLEQGRINQAMMEESHALRMQEVQGEVQRLEAQLIAKEAQRMEEMSQVRLYVNQVHF